MTTVPEAMATAIQHHAAGRLQEAEQIYQQVLQVEPTNASAIHLLGVIAHQLGSHEIAIQLINAAITLRPDVAELHNDVGLAKFFLGQIPAAIADYRRAIDLRPDYAEAHSNLASAYELQGDLDSAIAHHHRALTLRPDMAEAHNNLGNAHRAQGQMDQAIACYRRAIELKPDFPIAHSNLIYALLFSPQGDPVTLKREHERWNDRHAKLLAPSSQCHQNARTRDRRLRIGYVSPDFRQHVVGQNLLPLFRMHDRQKFEIYAYSGVSRPDATTARFQAYADAWKNVGGLSDPQLADLIRGDRIDILVDLSLHMAGNRLLMFARMPAPIQVTFAGYPGTTGLTAIEYRLTDPYLDPSDLNDDHYSEQSIRLPNSFWCYEPFDSDLPVNDLPALDSGRITFGCLNNFCKINLPVVRLWSQVLRAVPGSQLTVSSPRGVHRNQFLDIMCAEGISHDRVTFVPFLSREEYLRRYHMIDICLDTLPYNGHTTSLDALWMGVPVITLVGQTVAGRAGYSQLMNLQLPDLVAQSVDEFVGIAASLANNKDRLIELRKTLRQRMVASPLMDAARFTKDIESAYRRMWLEWQS